MIIDVKQSIIERYLYSMGKVRKLGIWVSRIINGNNNQRVKMCALLVFRHRLARQQHGPLLSQSVIGNENSQEQKGNSPSKSCHPSA